MMRLEMSMTKDEQKFVANTWWATSPEFVLYTLRAQLYAAAAVWPELADYAVGKLAPPKDGELVENDKPNAADPDGTTIS